MSIAMRRTPGEPAIEAPRSRYSQIADVVRRRIEDGTYPPGSQLPSELELAADFDVSRVTINKAIWSLRAAGFVRVRRGAGTVVRATPQIVRDGRHPYEQRFDRTGAGRLQAGLRSPTVHIQCLSIGREAAPPRVAPLLQLQPEAPVLRRRWRLFSDDEPIQIAESYIGWAIAMECPQLSEPNARPDQSYARLAGIGYGPSHVAEDINVRPASGLAAEDLDLDGPQPVIEIVRVAFAAGNTPVEVALHVLPSSTWTLHYE